MDCWEKITTSHVIRKFGEICYKWWRTDVRFYDECGICQGKGPPFQNPVCRLIQANAKGAKYCLQEYKYLLDGHIQKAAFFTCHAGLDGIAIPLHLKERYVGAMVCVGFKFLDTKEKGMERHISKLSRLGIDKIALEQCYSGITRLTDHLKTYLNDFVELIAEDVVSFYRRLQEEEDTRINQARLQEISYSEKYKGIFVTSPTMKRILGTLELVENVESPVLIEGESGTGKELLATAIHYNSPRRHKMFVIQNCSMLNNTLLNSELFGHERGAFTGAVSNKKGLFEMADGGTLFLDEIGDMTIEAQARLLRVLQNGTFYRVGGTKQLKVDVRIIAATNKMLKKHLQQGLFREDLFYRINTIHITLPPLRERRGDIILLANYFLDSWAQIHREKKKELSHEVLEQLVIYSWPGNVRELKNMIERLIILSGKDNTIYLHHLTDDIKGDICVSLGIRCYNDGPKLRNRLKLFEKEIIEETLKKVRWNKSMAARELGISRASLNNKIEEFHTIKCYH